MSGSIVIKGRVGQAAERESARRIRGSEAERVPQSRLNIVEEGQGTQPWEETFKWLGKSGRSCTINSAQQKSGSPRDGGGRVEGRDPAHSAWPTLYKVTFDVYRVQGNMLLFLVKALFLFYGVVLSRCANNIHIPLYSQPVVARCTAALWHPMKKHLLLIDQLKDLEFNFLSSHCTWRHTKPCYNIINTRWRHH